MKICHYSTYHLIILWLILSSCGSPKVLSEKELVAYVQEASNGLVKKQESGGINFTLSYRPNDLVILQDVGKRADTSAIREASERYGDYAYFILSMEAQGKNALYGASTDMNAFSEHLQTLSFRMAEKARLITSEQDTIPTADYIFDRTYGMGATTLMFVFSKEKLSDAEWFIFHLKDFGMRTGDQRFRFQMKDIRKVPELKEISIDHLSMNGKIEMSLQNAIPNNPITSNLITNNQNQL